MIAHRGLEAAAPKLRQAFHVANPFPHLVIDELFEEDAARKIEEAFFPLNASYRSHRHYHSKKYSIQDPARYPLIVREALEELQTPRFVAWLQQVTGIDGLVADPHGVGMGMHVIGRGGFLDVHADFNVHPVTEQQRILNLLIYFNSNWQPEWGGDLELWFADMRQRAQRIAPLLNRAVLFEVSGISFHGVPEKLQCPEGRQRNSLQLYYNRDGPTSATPRQIYTTDYRPRPRDFRKRLRHAITRAIGPRRP
jgi:Rps23 Pro-64 3,4-dihydroxylase Tpa1-like proline 4-hydroxylase